MRWAFVALATVAAAAGVAAVIAACSSAPACKPGTLLLHVALFDEAPLADTITVEGDDPGASVSESFPHVPNPVLEGTQEHVDVVVTWPQGYPSDYLIHLTIRALEGSTVVGHNLNEIRLGETCTETGTILSDRNDPIQWD